MGTTAPSLCEKLFICFIIKLFYTKDFPNYGTNDLNRCGAFSSAPMIP